MTLLEELRKETAELHQQLDNWEVALRLMSSEVAAIDYFQYLQSFCALHVAVEPILYREVARFFPELAFNQRLSLLEKELHQHRLTAPIIDASVDLQEIEGMRCLGAIYVMEGSRLGGRFIANHLGKHQARIGVTEFPFLTEKPTVSWNAFLAFLATVPDNERDIVVTAAKYMFNFVRLALEKAVEIINEKNSI
ncbi:MAG: biliverdin-producing heme oxygenase [Crocinitomicaceae bacterium]|nr:biliverdin-producing heme oxygenase [Crocinitomicaceae bacterium]